jgi:hypothetical protein
MEGSEFEQHNPTLLIKHVIIEISNPIVSDRRVLLDEMAQPILTQFQILQNASNR